MPDLSSDAPYTNRLTGEKTYPRYTSEGMWLFCDFLPKFGAYDTLSDDGDVGAYVRNKIERMMLELMETEGCTVCKQITCICEPMIEEDRFTHTPPVSEIRIESSGLSPQEFMSIFNDGTKLVALMSNEERQDRIRELTLAITKLKVTLYAVQMVQADAEAKLSREEREALRKRDRSFRVKPEESVTKTAKPAASKEEKVVQGLMKNLGLSEDAAWALVRSSKK